jgi:hypothetical protein
VFQLHQAAERYFAGKKYHLKAEELTVLGECVRELGALMEHACQEKIESLEAEAGAQGPLASGWNGTRPYERSQASKRSRDSDSVSLR